MQESFVSFRCFILASLFIIIDFTDVGSRNSRSVSAKKPLVNTCELCGKIITQTQERRKRDLRRHGGNSKSINFENEEIKLSGTLKKIDDNEVPLLKLKFHARLKKSKPNSTIVVPISMAGLEKSDIKNTNTNKLDSSKPRDSTSISTNTSISEKLEIYLKDRVSFPWQRFVVNDYFQHYCASVVLNKKYLLASNNCMEGFDGEILKYLAVVSAFPNSASFSSFSFLKSVSPVIEALIPHPKFTKLEDGEIENDLVVIRTSGKIFKAQEDFVPICLPLKREMHRGPEKKLIQIFWIMHQKHLSQPTAIATTVMNPEGDYCGLNVKHKTRQKPMHRFCTRILPKDNFCPDKLEARTAAYISSYDSREERLTLIGLFSYGESICRNSETPTEVAVFTRIDQYMDWIEKIIQDGECT